MSKVVKFSCAAIVGMLFYFNSNAQIIKLPKVLAFGNFTYANPQGNFGNLYKNGIGFEIGAGLGFGKTLLYASTGSINYGSGKTGSETDLKVVPFKFGVRRYLLLGLFVNATAGVATQTYRQLVVSSSSGPIVLKDVNESTFNYEVGAGFKFLGFIEIGAAYTGWNHNGSNANSILLKAGVALKL